MKEGRIVNYQQQKSPTKWTCASCNLKIWREILTKIIQKWLLQLFQLGRQQQQPLLLFAKFIINFKMLKCYPMFIQATSYFWWRFKIMLEKVVFTKTQFLLIIERFLFLSSRFYRQRSDLQFISRPSKLLSFSKHFYFINC